MLEIRAEFPAAQAAGSSLPLNLRKRLPKSQLWTSRMKRRKIIASYVSPHAFAPRTRAALVGLGYRVVAASTRGRFDDTSWQPDLRIVDDRHFDKLPVENYLPRTPVIVLTRRPAAAGGATRGWWARSRVRRISPSSIP